MQRQVVASVVPAILMLVIAAAPLALVSEPASLAPAHRLISIVRARWRQVLIVLAGKIVLSSSCADPTPRQHGPCTHTDPIRYLVSIGPKVAIDVCTRSIRIASPRRSRRNLHKRAGYWNLCEIWRVLHRVEIGRWDVHVVAHVAT